MQIYTTPLVIAVLVIVVVIHLPHTHAQDINECVLNPYICGYAYNPAYGQNGPTGACVNTIGSYYCVCYPPFVGTHLNRSCSYYQPPQQNIFQDPYSLFLFEELFDFDLF
ncbi:uncharacterized protein [Haliotis asinina]|uniref:uncharacterized protein n=1 Tax=Haliotis asinina TaxID=109174 RepID=UPI00353225D7